MPQSICFKGASWFFAHYTSRQFNEINWATVPIWEEQVDLILQKLIFFFLFTVLFSEEKYQELSGDMYLAVIVGQ